MVPTAEDEEELEMLRRRRMANLNAQMQQQEAMEDQRKRVEEGRKEVMRQIMEPVARERLGRLRMTYPEVVENVENQLITLATQGRLGRKVTDADLVTILQRVQPKKRDITIKRIGREEERKGAKRGGRKEEGEEKKGKEEGEGRKGEEGQVEQ